MQLQPRLRVLVHVVLVALCPVGCLGYFAELLQQVLIRRKEGDQLGDILREESGSDLCCLARAADGDCMPMDLLTDLTLLLVRWQSCEFARGPQTTSALAWEEQ